MHPHGESASLRWARRAADCARPIAADLANVNCSAEISAGSQFIAATRTSGERRVVHPVTLCDSWATNEIPVWKKIPVRKK
jgi:hypothetical protein